MEETFQKNREAQTAAFASFTNSGMLLTISLVLAPPLSSAMGALPVDLFLVPKQGMRQRCNRVRAEKTGSDSVRDCSGSLDRRLSDNGQLSEGQ